MRFLFEWKSLVDKQCVKCINKTKGRQEKQFNTNATTNYDAWLRIEVNLHSKYGVIELQQWKEKYAILRVTVNERLVNL